MEDNIFKSTIEELFNQANQEIQKKKERDKIRNEKINEFNSIVSKLNELLEELDINNKIFLTTVSKSLDINENIKILHLEPEINNAFIEIIDKTIQEYKDIEMNIIIIDKNKLLNTETNKHNLQSVKANQDRSWADIVEEDEKN